MKSKKKNLQDILGFINEIFSFVKEDNCNSLEDFEKNRMLFLSVERLLEKIGEAFNRIIKIEKDNLKEKVFSKSKNKFREEATRNLSKVLDIDIELVIRKIDHRNALSHSYDNPNNPVNSWEIITNDLEVWKRKINIYLENVS